MFSIWINIFLSSLDGYSAHNTDFLALVKVLFTYIWRWLAKCSSSSFYSACGDRGLKQIRKIFSNKCPCIFSTWPNWRKEEDLFSKGRGRMVQARWDYPKLHLVFFYHIYFALPCLILLTLWFHEIFLKPSSWPKTMYAEHWRKLAWAMEHLWTVAYLNMLLCFQSKISFNRLFWLFILI